MAEPAKDKPTEGVPAPQFVTKEQFEEGMNKIAGAFKDSISQLRDGWVQQSGRQTPPAPEPELPEPGEDDDIPTATKKIEAKLERKWGARFAQLENVGLGTMAKLTERTVAPGLKHFKRFKAEIDQTLSGMDPNLRAQPEAIEYAYTLVVGRHQQELEDEALEAERRTHRASTPPAPKHGGMSSDDDFKAKNLPTPKELGISPEQIRVVEKRGGWDKWAKRIGFKNYEEYAKDAQAMRTPPAESDEE